jgi:hypothetical protein
MKMIQKYFKGRCNVETDINEHLPTLKEYGEKCSHITEFGLRGGESTCAFLAAKPQSLVTYDIDENCKKTFEKLNPYANGTRFSFICADTSKKEQFKIEKTDLLFIDTAHTYSQAKQELAQSDMVKKYIILHDTETFGTTGHDGGKGLTLAIIEFLRRTRKWQIHKHFSNNNGLTILKRR